MVRQIFKLDTKRSRVSHDPQVKARLLLLQEKLEKVSKLEIL